MAQISNSEFGTLRSLFWPIHRQEYRKLVPMLIMLFCICFNYSLLRNVKDVVFITAAGAEVIPFVKVWGIFPMAILVTVIFTKLSNTFTQEKVFYFMVSGFLSFYILFAFIIYPARDFIHLDHFADYLQTLLPAGFKGLIYVLRYWSYTAFYVMSELWSTSIMTVLFWGLANKITKLTEAKRFYCVLSIGSNFASITAGLIAGRLTHLDSVFGFLLSHDPWEQALMLLTLLIALSGIVAMLTYRWMVKNVGGVACYKKAIEPENKDRPRLSLKKSLNYVLNSNYLTCIAIIVVSYNLVINLVEVIWKNQLRAVHPSTTQYSDCISNLLILQGIISTVLALATSKLIDIFGWTRAALITPIVILVSSIAFFGGLFFSHQAPYELLLFGVSPHMLAVHVGSIQNSTIKATKYSIFDTTKEMSYVPLTPEQKIQGKTAIDGIGSRFGKFGGSIIYQSLLLFLVTIGETIPVVAVILFLVLLFWFASIRSLGHQLAKLNPQIDPEMQEEEILLEESPKPA
ncbi:MAG: Npt1/Npt2 family nucleotide transporter [Parachlamydiaceae bacterium]